MPQQTATHAEVVAEDGQDRLNLFRTFAAHWVGALRYVIVAACIAVLPGGLVAQAPTPSATQAQAAAPAKMDPTEETRLKAALQIDPASVRDQYALAYLLFRANRPKESLEAFTRAAQLRQPTARDLQTVALNYVLLDDYADADRWMTTSVQADAANATAWYDLGRIKYTENRFAESIAAFQRSITLDPDSVKAIDNLGLALEGLGRSAEAAAAYGKAIAMADRLGSRTEQPLLNYAILLINQGEAERALALLQKATEIAPGNGKIHEQMGRAYERLGRLPEAESALQHAIASKPQSSALHFQLGQILKKEGKSAEAKEEFARVAALRGTRSDSTP